MTKYLQESLAAWHPTALSHCIDSWPLSMYLMAGSSMVVVLYFLIMRVWLNLAARSSPAGREAWVAMSKLFGMCAMAGYASIILVFFSPALGIILRTVALTAVVFYSALFLRKYPVVLLEMGRHEALGAQIAKMTDRELSSLTSAIVNQRLQNRTDGQQ